MKKFLMLAVVAGGLTLFGTTKSAEAHDPYRFNAFNNGSYHLGHDHHSYRTLGTYRSNNTGWFGGYNNYSRNWNFGGYVQPSFNQYGGCGW